MSERTVQPSEPTPCANGCGFFGTAATNNLCSKCFRDRRIEEETAADASLAFNKSVFGNTSPAEKKVDVVVVPAIDAGVEEEKKVVSKINRCGCCNKKVGITGFACRCGVMYCGKHRYPEEHNCNFNFKKQGKEAIAKANPVVKADKIQRF